MNDQTPSTDIDSVLVQLGEFSYYCMLTVVVLFRSHLIFMLVFLLAKYPSKNYNILFCVALKTRENAVKKVQIHNQIKGV